MGVQRKDVICLVIKSLLVWQIFFIPKKNHVVTILSVEKIIEVCYLQNIRFPLRVDTLNNPTAQISTLSKCSISQFAIIYIMFTF